MSNMSYCRFENTDRDLADCQEALEELVAADCEPLSSYELEAARRLVARCFDIVMIVAEAGAVPLNTPLDEFEGESLIETLSSINSSAEEEN